MSYSGLIEDLVQPILYGALTVLAFVQWRRHPGPASAWLAVAFGVLGVVLVAGLVLPESSTSPAAEWAGKGLIAILALFPYSLYRFMGSLVRRVRWIKIVALVLTIAVAGGALLLPSFPEAEGDRPLWFEIYIGVLLLQWVFLSGVVAVRLWRAGRGQPTVPRRRMQIMSLGAAGLALALVVAGEFAGGGVTEIVFQLLVLAAAPLMIVGFAPPYPLRAWWRRHEDVGLRQAELSLMRATTTSQVAATLLPSALQLVGAAGAVLQTDDGTVIAQEGVPGDPEQGDVAASSDTSTLTIPMRSHRLIILTSPFTPFFGREEIARLEGFAGLADLALNRNKLLDDQRLLAAIVESSTDAIIGKTLDGTITSWNRGAEVIYGYRSDEVIGRSVSILVPQDDEDDVPLLLERISKGEEIDLYETKRQTKAGEVIDVSLSVSPLRDGSGSVVGASVIARDVSGQKAAQEGLRLAQREAERANASKTEFLSRMSHELRTPLNAIMGFTQLLDLDELTPDQRDSTDQIMKGGRRLLELINEVLDIARIESGQLVMSIEAVPVAEAARSTAELIRPLADERSITLVVDVADDEERHVVADRQRLDQVLLNLLSNAVKYNVEEGKVTIHIAPAADDTVRIGIRDTGPGVADEDIPRLFTPFDRLDAEQTGVEGTGLGLTLSKNLVESMGGRIEVDSGHGRGTTFWVELQATLPPEPEMATTPAPAETVPLEAAAYQLLYIEDNLSNRRLVERLLSRRRPSVTLLAAMTGDLGLDLARQHAPDLILLDLHLPDIGGDEVLARLRKDPRTADIPVVMLSADATPGQIQRLLAAGAREYLTKPIDVAAFMDVVDRTLSEGEVDR